MSAPDDAGSSLDAAALLARLIVLPAGERMAAVRVAGEPEAVLVALGDEAEGMAAVEVAGALAASEMVVALADEADLPRARARARRAQAMVLANAGRLEEALSSCHSAVVIAEEARLEVEAARGRLASVPALAGLGRFDEAVAAGETARAVLVGAGEPALAARADINLGAAYEMGDDPKKALLHYDRAKQALVDEPVSLAQLQGNRGAALMSLDDFVGAEDAFRAAEEFFRSDGQDWAVAIAEGNLAYLALRQGRMQRALHHFERARRLLEHDESPAHLARLIAEQAEALAFLGLPADAVLAYEEALPRLEAQGATAEVAFARAGYGRALLRLGRGAHADAALDAAGGAFDALGMMTPRARVDLARAESALAGGRLHDAKSLASAAFEGLRERPAEAVLARHLLARLSVAAGDVTTAADHLAEALQVAQSLDLAPVLADLYHTRALLAHAGGDAAGAMGDLRSAVRQVERVRGTLQAERYRAAFLGNRLAIYEDFVAAALDRGDPAALVEAFGVVEQAKSRALLDLVGGALDLADAAENETDDPSDAALLADLARLRRELNWLYSRLGGDQHGWRGGAADETWQRAIHDRERQLDALQERIAVARGLAGLYAAPLDAASALRLLPAGAALVEYFVAGGEWVAFVLRDGTIQVFRGPVSGDVLIDRLRRFHFQIGRALASLDRIREGNRDERLLNDVLRESAALDAVLIAPLRQALAGVERLVIVPHGPLHTLPFHALWNAEQGRYLIETCEVTYAPSASLLAHLPSNDVAPGAVRAVVVGVPDALAPAIAAEAEQVAAVLDGSLLLLGDAATVDRVTSEALTADVVHLACHGRFSAEIPLGSGLKLADRWLTVRDVYGLHLRASLVTLSGCDTGRTAVGGGDELIGLIRGFFAAGASSLILSLWLVNDESTAELMSDFYDGWRRGASKPAALRSAQRALLAKRPHPAFWAPFILGGNP